MDVTTTEWTAAQVAAIAPDADEIPVLDPDEVRHLVPGTWLWDLWPLREAADAGVTEVAGGELWFALSAPAVGHPGGRHDVTRLGLLHRVGDDWRWLGHALPEPAGLGSREWAGAAWHDDGLVTIDHTASGVRGEQRPTFRQRIVTTTARLEVVDGVPRLVGHTPVVPLLSPDGVRYHTADETEGEAGFIKAFRDPFRWRDPVHGEVVLFTGSLASSSSGYDGVVGLATLGPDGPVLHDPLLTADGVNNELERPHLVAHDGRLLLFVSTQARTFHPGTSGGRSGLYGWVAEDLTGPFRPLNGTGLVAATPRAEPLQTYSWLVLPDLTVTAFIDAYALVGRTPEEVDAAGEEEVRRHFGGTLAPPFRLWVGGDRAGIAD